MLKHDQLLTEKELKQVYKGNGPKNGVKINVTECMDDENTCQKGIIDDINQKKVQNQWNLGQFSVIM